SCANTSAPSRRAVDEPTGRAGAFDCSCPGILVAACSGLVVSRRRVAGLTVAVANQALAASTPGQRRGRGPSRTATADRPRRAGTTEQTLRRPAGQSVAATAKCPAQAPVPHPLSRGPVAYPRRTRLAGLSGQPLSRRGADPLDGAGRRRLSRRMPA